jgi:hypothetical protein
LKPHEYYDCCIDEVFLFIKAYRDRVIAESTDAWRRSRLIVYQVWRPYAPKGMSSVSIYDFMPLQGDPTPEERIKWKEEEYREMLGEVNRLEIMAKQQHIL